MDKSISFTFPANKVKGAAIFAAVKDIRYYLNGVHFSTFGDFILAQATDGHRLTVISHPRAGAEEFAVIIPADQYDAFPESLAHV
jgi:DNA polymerase III sliding clamp (beta) subunit (PCNA family)